MTKAQKIPAKQASKLTLNEMRKWLGKPAKWTPYQHDGIEVDVEILDAKVSYGRIRLEIRPAAGTGRIWIQGSQVKISGIGPMPTYERPDLVGAQMFRAREVTVDDLIDNDVDPKHLPKFKGMMIDEQRTKELSDRLKS